MLSSLHLPAVVAGWVARTIESVVFRGSFWSWAWGLPWLLPQQWQTCVWFLRQGGRDRSRRRRGEELKLKPWGNGKHMQLKVSGVRRQKQEKDSEKRGWKCAWACADEFLRSSKEKIHESLISQLLVHYLIPFNCDSRLAGSYPGFLYLRLMS